MVEPGFLRTIREAYDAFAVRYAESPITQLEGVPLDRAMLAAFAELVQATGLGAVADLGCGPGHVTAHLHSLGLLAFGVDVSPAMIALARRAHPGLRFDVGSMTSLDVTNGALGGVLARYSIIHTPPEGLPGVFAEFDRVLAPGGHLLLSSRLTTGLRNLRRRSTTLCRAPIGGHPASSPACCVRPASWRWPG